MTAYRELQPVHSSARDFEALEEEILDVLRQMLLLVVRPLIELQPKLFDAFVNAKLTALELALNRGTIVYSQGVFSGKFTAETSKELQRLGAKWDKKRAAWRLPQSKMPDELRPVAAASAARLRDKLQAVEKVLESIDPAKVAGKVRAKQFFESSLLRTDRRIRKTLKDITIVPELTKEMREAVARDYAQNLQRSIQTFTAEETLRLRKRIQRMVLRGERFETAVAAIGRSFHVSADKAKFLARQETNLLTVALKKQRYTEAGIEEYKWRCVHGSPAHPVRPAHKALDGTIQRWDAPPITSEPGQPVRRNHAGEDYNCRCTAVPLVRKSK